MKRRNFFKLIGMLAVATSTSKIFSSIVRKNAVIRNTLINPFRQSGNWYKAALHVHTTTSDGDVDVFTRLKQYKEKGFHIVAITDHRKTNNLSGYSSDNFIAISSIEFHPETYSGAPAHHFLGIGLPHPYEYNDSLSAQEIIDDIKSRGAKVFYAHPYWTGHTYIEMTEVTGYLGLEVYNEVCQNANSGSGHVHWDQMLNKGYTLSGLATDDAHNSKAVGKAWTMIKADNLEEQSILDALENGCFYATKGPILEDFYVDNEFNVVIKCSPVKKINFRCNGAGNGSTFESKDSLGLTFAKWNLTKKKPKWVRCEVIDENDNIAWTNPIFI